MSRAASLPLEDAMPIKSYQLAITGSRRRWEENRQDDPRARKAPPQRRAPRSPRITSQIEEDPENALDALEILGVASRTAGANAGDSRNAHLRLERWAVEAALRRRNFEELSSSDLHLIRRCTLDGDAVKWPRSSLHHA
jgi:hypothetical protein